MQQRARRRAVMRMFTFGLSVVSATTLYFGSIGQPMNKALAGYMLVCVLYVCVVFVVDGFKQCEKPSRSVSYRQRGDDNGKTRKAI